MANYRYKINLTYVHKTGKNKYVNYSFTSADNVAGCIIHSDYVNNNMPIIILDLYIQSKIANIMLNTDNMQSDYIILNISKFDINDDMEIELPYIEGIFNYYSFDQIDKSAVVNFDENINQNDPDLIMRKIKIGLHKSDLIRGNSIVTNGIINNTTMQDLVQDCLNRSGLKTVVEQFNYNTKLDQIIIPPSESLSKVIENLNEISVFYKTQYRFFMDFDVTYLISSSGNAVPKKGETINSVMFDIGDITDKTVELEGVQIIKKRGFYYVPITFKDCQLADDYIASQQYSSLTVIGSNSIGQTNLDLRSGDNAINLTKTIRINNNNSHMIENLASSIANSNTAVSIYKVGVDNSIFTPNKEYSIKYNNTYDENHNGYYLLNSKQEVFVKDGNRFVSSVMLSLNKIGS